MIKCNITIKILNQYKKMGNIPCSLQQIFYNTVFKTTDNEIGIELIDRIINRYGNY